MAFGHWIMLAVMLVVGYILGVKYPSLLNKVTG